MLNLENSLKTPDVSVLPLFFFFFNVIHVTGTVWLVVSNSLCSFPGKRKSSLKGSSGFLSLSLDLSQDFTWFHGVKTLNAYAICGIVLIN